MSRCLFASDLHGRSRRYEALFAAVRELRPRAVFLGGDLLPFPYHHLADAPVVQDFVRDYLVPRLTAVRSELGDAYPRIFLIPGNDDPLSVMEDVLELESLGLWTWMHGRALAWDGFIILGYAYVPPTPFQLKDWERYDVGPHVSPGCVSPEEGYRSVEVEEREPRYATIAEDLELLSRTIDMERVILLAHTPPYGSKLDRAALDGRLVDHAPLDVHVGSVAMRRFIESRQPLLSLHGHIHESARLTGAWRDRIGRTHCLSAAHDGPELALVRFDPERLEEAARELR